jgi:hypothetical protein
VSSYIEVRELESSRGETNNKRSLADSDLLELQPPCNDGNECPDPLQAGRSDVAAASDGSRKRSQSPSPHGRDAPSKVEHEVAAMCGERPGPAKRQRLDKDTSSREDPTRNPAPATASTSSLKRPIEIDDSEDSYVCHIFIPSKYRFTRGCCWLRARLVPLSLTIVSRQENEGKVVSAKRIKTKSGERLKEHSSAITVLKSVEYASIARTFLWAFFANIHKIHRCVRSPFELPEPPEPSHDTEDTSEKERVPWHVHCSPKNIIVC